jgi:hypothetical protein
MRRYAGHARTNDPPTSSAVMRKAAPARSSMARTAGVMAQLDWDLRSPDAGPAAPRLSGPGRPLPDDLRSRFEQRFDHDFSRIRVHTDAPAADALARAFDARAFTSGHDIVFSRGAYDPGTTAGRKLLAHELTHVVQQSAGVPFAGRVSQPGDAAEAEADRAAEAVSVGGHAGPIAAVPSAIARQPAPGTTAAAPVQMTLSTSLRASLEVRGPVDYNGLIAMIHAAPTAERRAVLSDAALRSLINSRLSGARASTVFSSLLEGSQRWSNPPRNDFYTFFITNNGNGPLPNTATMNCWESIVYAAFLAQQVTAAWIRSFYTTATSAPPADITATFWQLLHFSTALPTYAAPARPGTGGGLGAPGRGTTVTPRAGQLLFYHSGGAIPAHVAVSLGGDQAISLWNQPNNIASVQRIQVTAIPGTVYVGDPPW